MHKIIVSDTSCLILLEKINRLDLLYVLFGDVIITEVVAGEFGKNLPSFITVENPENLQYQKIIGTSLDIGEASSIALAMEKKDCLLILDDNRARRIAKKLELKFTGTLGILILAKEKGIINSLSNVLEDVKKTNFRISESLTSEAKRRVCE
jgi:predicted nucleic acid-binding protein